MLLRKEFTFDAAHFLPKVPEGHKCGRMHGHTYRVGVEVAGPIEAEAGWVIDFGDVKEPWKRLEAAFLDHHLLNDIIENPTAENLAWWLFEELVPELPGLRRIEVWETATSMVALGRLEFDSGEAIDPLTIPRTMPHV